MTSAGLLLIVMLVLVLFAPDAPRAPPSGDRRAGNGGRRSCHSFLPGGCSSPPSSRY